MIAEDADPLIPEIVYDRTIPLGDFKQWRWLLQAVTGTVFCEDIELYSRYDVETLYTACRFSHSNDIQIILTRPTLVDPTNSDYEDILKFHYLNLLGELMQTIQNLAFVRTAEELIALRAMTGVLRINEHHFANNVSTAFTDFDYLQKGYNREALKSTVVFLKELGYLVESRDSGTDSFAINAFYITELDLGHKFMVAAIHISVSSEKLRYASYVADGHDVKESKIIAFLEQYKSTPPTTINYVVGFTPNGEADITIRVVDENFNPPKDMFYPYLEGGLDGVTESFLDDKNNLLLLIGPPGTGKSTLLRHLCRSAGERKIYQFCGEKVLTHPAFDAYLTKIPENSLVLIEEADTLIGKREEGNTSISTLLNELSGVTVRDVKFVITTNLENTKMIEPALFRPGRCYALKQFKHLTRDQAAVIVAELNLPEDRIRDNVSLADVLDGPNAAELTAGPGFRV